MKASLEVGFGPIAPALGADVYNTVHPSPRNVVGSITAILLAGKLSHGALSGVTDLGATVP